MVDPKPSTSSYMEPAPNDDDVSSTVDPEEVVDTQTEVKKFIEYIIIGIKGILNLNITSEIKEYIIKQLIPHLMSLIISYGTNVQLMEIFNIMRGEMKNRDDIKLKTKINEYELEEKKKADQSIKQAALNKEIIPESSLSIKKRMIINLGKKRKLEGFKERQIQINTIQQKNNRNV